MPENTEVEMDTAKSEAMTRLETVLTSLAGQPPLLGDMIASTEVQDMYRQAYIAARAVEPGEIREANRQAGIVMGKVFPGGSTTCVGMKNDGAHCTARVVTSTCCGTHAGQTFLTRPAAHVRTSP